MKGSIRTLEKCPICKAAFTHIPQNGFLCLAHRDQRPHRFFLDFYYQGRRIRLFSDTDGVLEGYQRASNFKAKIDYEIKHHQFDPSKYVRQEVEKFWVANLLDDFQKAREKEISPSWKPHFKLMVQRAQNHFGAMDVRELRKMHIIEYKNKIESLKLSPKTIKNHIDHFHSFLAWAKTDMEMIDMIPPFPDVPVPPSSFSWILPEEQIKIFEKVPGEDKPIFAFLILQGCRPAEARALKCKDVNIEAGTVTINRTWSYTVLREQRKGRGAQPVVIPIHRELYEYISQRVRGSLPEAWLFANPRTGRHYTDASLRRVWENVKKKANISGLRLYDITRHSFASNLINQGDSIYMVSQLLGHTDIRTTQKYSHASIQGKRMTLDKLSLKKVITLGSDRAVAEGKKRIF